MNFEDLINNAISIIEKYDGVVLSYIAHFCFAILIFIIGRAIARFVARQLRKILTNRHVDPTVVKFVSSLSYYAIIVMTLVACWGNLAYKPHQLLPLLVQLV